MSKSLGDLCDCLRLNVDQLLQQAPGFHLLVIETLRSPEQQTQNILNGVSWTKKSRHLAQPGCNKAHAIDVAPRYLLAEKNWAPSHPDWELLGVLGESLGLSWGGRWKHRDCPHFEVNIRHK